MGRGETRENEKAEEGKWGNKDRNGQSEGLRRKKYTEVDPLFFTVKFQSSCVTLVEQYQQIDLVEFSFAD